MKITKPFLKQLREELDAAVASIGAKYDLRIRTGNATFSIDGSNATFKLEVAAIGEGGEVVTREATAFKTYAPMEGYQAEALGQIVKVGAESYKITGYNAKAQKFPILGQRVSDGKTYKLPLTVLRDFKIEGHWRWKGPLFPGTGGAQ